MTRPAEELYCEPDLDLHDPGSADDLRAAFAEHGLLVFRNQNLSLAEQERILGYLGPVQRSMHTVGYISNTKRGGLLGNAEVSFHCDFMYTAIPALGISLHAVAVDDGETSTRFASNVRALERLPDSVRRRLDGLTGINLFTITQEALTSGAPRLDGYPAEAPRADHPIVSIDETSGREVLYVTESYTSAIAGIEPDASKALLQDLFATLYQDDNIYEHFWYQGDFVIWSNYAFQHARSALNASRERTLQRVCITHAPESLYLATNAYLPKERIVGMEPASSAP